MRDTIAQIRVDSSDEASLGEDASKHGRIIDEIDADEGITLIDETVENQGSFNNQEDAKILFDVADDLGGKKVFVSQEVPLQEVIATAATTTIATIDDITLAKALMEIKSAKPKDDKINADYQLAQRLQVKEQEELTDEKGWKPKSLKNKFFANIQEFFNKAMKRVNTFADYRTELVVESSKKAKAEVTEGSSKRDGE
nr:hypothetical protein [Tanacetum cinerariifolium]